MKRVLFLLAMCLLTCQLQTINPSVAHAADSDGWESIFDGKTLKGWDGNPKHWSVKDGAITGITTKETPTKGNTFIIWKGGEPGDFELKVTYRIFAGNSGIQYRSFKLPGKNDGWRIGGYQADFESGTRYNGICYGERFRGILSHRGKKSVIDAKGKSKAVETFAEDAAVGKAIKPKGEWNTYHITAKGFHFVQKINGVKTTEFNDDHEGVRRDKGLIALQLHAGPAMKVQFKDIMLKRIKKSARINLNQDGAIQLNGQAITLKDLEKQLPAFGNITLKADTKTPYKYVAAVMNVSKEANVKTVNLVATIKE